jgi:hypothetical protein
VDDHLSLARKRFRHRQYRQVSAEELRSSRVLAEDQVPNIRVQPVGADHDVEPAWRRALEGHLAVGGDGRDRVAEQILDLVAAGVVVRLTEVISHDLYVTVGCGADRLGEIDADRLPGALAINPRAVSPGGQRLDFWQHTHLFRDLHGRSEKVNCVTPRLTQCRCALDDGDVEPVPGEPVREDRARDAGPGDQNPHDDPP